MSSDERSSHEKLTRVGTPDSVRGGRGRSGTYGLLAATLFLMASMLVAALAGVSPLLPLRMMASVVLGAQAMDVTPLGATIVLGLVVHAVLTAFFGFLYGVLHEKLSPESRSSPLRQAALGLLFGLAIYLVDLQLVSRVLYPWLLVPAQWPVVVLHAVAFGLPLALLFAVMDRRVLHQEIRASPPVPVRRPA